MGRLAVRFALICLGAVSCASGSQFSSSSRRSAEFAEVFADPVELVTTTEPADARERLSRARLPHTQAHHEQLLALLRSRPQISADHLLLLVEAVALPETIFVGDEDGRVHAYAARGRGEFSQIADRLLIEGAPKLVDVDRRRLGELLARSHSDAALNAVADRFIPALFDGSAAELREIVGAMRGSPATLPFLVGYLSPRELLDEERWLEWTSLFDFDSDRVELIRGLAPRIQRVSPDDLTTIVRDMDFDDGRTEVVGMLAAKTRPLRPDVARAVVAAFSFDEGRAAACAMMARDAELELGVGEIASVAELFSFDEGRLACVSALARSRRGSTSQRGALRVLDSFDFDEGRLGALRAIADACGDLTAEEREALVRAFSFQSSRDTAANVLRR